MWRLYKRKTSLNKALRFGFIIFPTNIISHPYALKKKKNVTILHGWFLMRALFYASDDYFLTVFSHGREERERENTLIALKKATNPIVRHVISL